MSYKSRASQALINSRNPLTRKEKKYSDVGVKICCEVEKEG